MIDPEIIEKRALFKNRWLARFSAGVAITIGLWVFYLGAFFYKSIESAHCNYWLAWFVAIGFFLFMYVFFSYRLSIKIKSIHKPIHHGLSRTPYKIIKYTAIFESVLISLIILGSMLGISAIGVSCKLGQYYRLQSVLSAIS